MDISDCRGALTVLGLCLDVQGPRGLLGPRGSSGPSGQTVSIPPFHPEDDRVLSRSDCSFNSGF